MKKFNKVLLVDDDPVANYLNKLFLQEVDMAEHILILESGKDALEFIKQHCASVSEEGLNLVILDPNIPVKGGLDLLTELKRLKDTTFINTRIAVLNSSEHAKDLAYLKELGVRHVFPKPLSEEQALYLAEKFDHDGQSFQ